MDYEKLGDELLKIEDGLSTNEFQKSEDGADDATIILSKFYPRPFTEQILKNSHFLWEGEKGYLWWFDKAKGIWRTNGEDIVQHYFRKLTNSLDDTQKKKYVINEIIADVQGYCLSLNGMPEPNMNLIPCNNGVYNIETGTFDDFEPTFYFTWKLPWNYNPQAISVFLKKLINNTLPNQDLITLWQLMAYCLWRGYPYQKFFILLGAGRNGKGVLMTILTRLLGSENVSNISLQDLQGSRFSASALYHKLVNISGEIDYTDLSNTQLLKQLTGGDWIQADRKYKNPVKFVNHAKLIFATNQVPKTRDTTDAFFRRAFIIKFPYQFEDNPEIDIKIRENTQEMQQEYEGLLVQIIQTLKNLNDCSFIFTNHQDINEARAVYEKLSNPLIQFINEKCEQTHDTGDFIFKYDFKAQLNDWLKEKSFNQMTNERIGREMKELGFEDGRKGEKRYRAWIGINWASVQDVQDVRVDTNNSNFLCSIKTVDTNPDNVDNVDTKTPIIEGEL